MPHSGAGVLLIELPTSHEDEAYIVLFHDIAKRAYTEPGGRCEPNHRGDPANTASAELFEETAALVHVSPHRLKTLAYVDHPRRNGHCYRAYVLFLATPIDARHYHHNVHHLHHQPDTPRYMLETNDMARISLSDALRASRDLGKPKRPWVQAKDGRWIRLHKRTVNVLRHIFADNERPMRWLRHALKVGSSSNATVSRHIET